MIIEHDECPRYLWISLLIVAVFNLGRGILHTFFVEYAATNIAGLDLSIARNELLNLMNVYGWSNIIEGILYMVIAIKSRNLAPLALTLAGIFIPFTVLTNNLANISLAGVKWGGAPYMLFIYTPLCLLPMFILYFQRLRNR